jgi:hypothetical protein
MNPFLERASFWPSFHSNFINACQWHLVAQIRPRYVVQIESRLYIHEPPADRRMFLGQADVGIIDPGVRPAPAVAATVAPLYGTLPTGIEFEQIRYLEIRDNEQNQVVTVIELLSPSNKYNGDDRSAYLGKRWQLIKGRLNLVELDLLRGGPRMPVEGLPECDYCAQVYRPEEGGKVGLWPWNLRDPMPIVPVPLRYPDPDAKLDLKQVLDRVYDEAGYADYIYRGRPEPRLSLADEAWAAGFVPHNPA